MLAARTSNKGDSIHSVQVRVEQNAKNSEFRYSEKSASAAAVEGGGLEAKFFPLGDDDRSKKRPVTAYLRHPQCCSRGSREAPEPFLENSLVANTSRNLNRDIWDRSQISHDISARAQPWL